MSCESIAIRAEGLGKTYQIFERPIDRLKQLLMGGRRQYGRQFAALSDVSFSLPRGQVLGIVGNNGAGKSTLLQLLCKTLTPTAGTLEVNGRIAALLELGAGFNPEFSGRENVYLNGAVLGLTSAEIDARYADIVEFSGIGEFIEQPVKTYSSGMYVRLAFAIATSVDPDILIIDEALSVGDGAFARKSFDRIMALRERGATILFCSHSMYQIEAICDKAIWLEHGRVRLLDSPEVVTRAYAASGNATNPTATRTTAETTAAVRLLEVKVTAEGQTGTEFVLHAGKSNLRVETRFSYDPALPLPSIAYGIETEGGVAVSSGSTVFDNQKPNLNDDGTASICLLFPQIPLMRGRYRLSIFLACEQALHAYDQALYCAMLTVAHSGMEQGVCFLPHIWNDEKTIVVVPQNA